MSQQIDYNYIPFLSEQSMKMLAENANILVEMTNRFVKEKHSVWNAEDETISSTRISVNEVEASYESTIDPQYDISEKIDRFSDIAQISRVQRISALGLKSLASSWQEMNDISCNSKLKSERPRRTDAKLNADAYQIEIEKFQNAQDRKKAQVAIDISQRSNFERIYKFAKFAQVKTLMQHVQNLLNNNPEIIEEDGEKINELSDFVDGYLKAMEENKIESTRHSGSEEVFPGNDQEIPDQDYQRDARADIQEDDAQNDLQEDARYEIEYDTSNYTLDNTASLRSFESPPPP